MERIFDNDVFDAVAARAAQEKFCKENRVPFFAPDTCGGTHYHPHPITNIWEHISVNYAMTYHITGCPICGRSFCD